jgi:hypothetical protein
LRLSDRSKGYFVTSRLASARSPLCIDLPLLTRILPTTCKMVERVYREPTVTVSAREHTSHSIALVGKLSKALRCFISVLGLRDPISPRLHSTVFGDPSCTTVASILAEATLAWIQTYERSVDPARMSSTQRAKKMRFGSRNAFAKRPNHKLSHVWLPFAVNAVNMHYSSTNHLLP